MKRTYRVASCILLLLCGIVRILGPGLYCLTFVNRFRIEITRLMEIERRAPCFDRYAAITPAILDVQDSDKGALKEVVELDLLWFVRLGRMALNSTPECKESFG